MAVNIGPKIGIDGEKQYRQEMQNIIQQGKTLAAEMDSVSSAFNNADASEKDYSKVTEKLNEQIANQQKLVEKMRDAVEKSAQATGENSTETLKWKEQLAKAEKGLSDLEGKAKNAAGGIDDLGKEEKETGEQTSIFGDVLKANLASEAIKKGIEMTVSAVKDVAKFFVEAIKGAAEYADEINTLSKTTGMSTDALQEYKYAAELLDVDLNTITGSVQKLKKSMDSAKDGTGATADAFAELGVNVTDSNGNLRDADKVFDDVINALKKIENPTERDAVAMKVLGKSAADLNPLIEAGADELNNLRKEAHNVGAVLDKETLGTLNGVKDGFDRLKNTWEAMKNAFAARIGSKILPDLEKIVKIFQEFAKTGDNGKLFDALTNAFNDFVKKIPRAAAKINQEIPKLIKNIAKKLPTVLKGLAQTIGELLGNAFKNLPELLSAGVTLIKSLIKGIVMFIPNLIDGIVHGFKNKEIDNAQADLIEKYKGIRDAINEIESPASRLADNMTDFVAKQKEAEHWVTIFEELEKKTDPTATDLDEMKIAAAKLNEIFPELGLTLDEETGKWNADTEAIKENIKTLELRARAEAYSSAAQGTLQDIAKLDIEQRGYKRTRSELEKQKKEAEDALADMQAAYEILIAAKKKIDENTWDADINAEFYAAIEDYADRTVNTYEEAEAIINELGSSIDSQQDAIDLYGTEIDELSKTIDAADTKLAELNAEAEAYFKTATALDQRAEILGKMIVKKTADGIEEEKQNLDNHIQTLLHDTENLLAEETDTISQKIETKWRTVGISQESAFAARERKRKEAVEAENSKLTNRIVKMIEDTSNTMENRITEASKNVQKTATESGDDIGSALMQGAKKGVREESASFIKAAEHTITAAIERMKKVAMIQSPSKVTEKLIGQNLALGVVKGWDDIFDGSRMRNAFSLNGAFGAMRGNTTNTTNLGGVNITVNAAQGQDANTIANIVMQKMQGQVNARRAVFA